MSKFIQNIISVRFLEVLDELLDKQLVASDAEFCKETTYSKQSLSQIRGGKRDVTIDLVSKMFTVFKGNPLYILAGKGTKTLTTDLLHIVEEPSTQYESNGRSHEDQNVIKTLERLVQSKDDNIKDLRELVQGLRKNVSFLEDQLKKSQPS